jgi:four helix bundle protein
MASSFRDLVVWQEAHKLALMIYKMTAGFPNSEQYGLTSQIQHAGVSVPANIVEGFSRQSWQEKVRFYNIAESSLEEAKYYLILANDLGYIRSIDELNEQADSVGRLLHRFSQGAQQNSQRPKQA